MANGDGPNDTFWQKVMRESEVIRIHICLVMMLQGALLVAGLGLRLLRAILGAESTELDKFASVDVWTSFALLVLFALFAVVSVTSSLISSLMQQWRGEDGNPEN